MINETSNYSIFAFKDNNRNIDLFHVKRLASSINQWGNISVILCNRRMEILDGQHRFLALRDSKLPIKYIVADIDDLAIPNLNSTQKRWGLKDYLNYGLNSNAESYFYLDFIRTNNPDLQLSSLIQIFGGSGRTKDFKGLSLNLSREDKERGERIISILNRFKDEFLIEHAYHSRFISGFLMIYKNPLYNHDHFAEQLQRYSGLMKRQANFGDYARNIEEIYNYKFKTKIKLCA